MIMGGSVIEKVDGALTHQVSGSPWELYRDMIVRNHDTYHKDPYEISINPYIPSMGLVYLPLDLLDSRFFWWFLCIGKYTGQKHMDAMDWNYTPPSV